MDLCLEADCESLNWSKQQWQQVATQSGARQVNATVRPGAFSLQILSPGLKCVVAFPGP
jgi:hypothetical protein